MWQTGARNDKRCIKKRRLVVLWKTWQDEESCDRPSSCGSRYSSMANLNLFTHAGTFRRVRPEFLCKWLEPARGYLAGRGFTFPEVGSDGAIDYDRLAGIFMEPDAGMPRELMHSASLIHEMSSEPAMNDLLDVAGRFNISIDVGDAPDPIDVAVQVWILKPDVLEQVHQMHQLDRPRGFVHYVTDQSPVPAFTEPTAQQTQDLEAALGEWFYNTKRGRHAKVWMYKRPGEYWFLVRHGLASKRQEIVSAEGSDTLIFRPGEYDVLVYNRSRGELRVHGCSQREVEVLRVLFGRHVFGDENFFPGGARFTLAPLVNDGRKCLACRDVAGIEDITLTEVQTYTGGRDWLRQTQQAWDLFTLIEQERVVLPEVDWLVRASFLVRFSDSKKRRMIKILGSNKLSVVRDGDTELMEKWLDARGFIIKRETNENEASEVLAVA